MAFIALTVIVSTLLPDCFHSPTKTSGPLTHAAFVWQQSWGDDVVSAVNGATTFDRLYVLAGVLSFSPQPAFQSIDIPVRDLRPGAGVVACLRIHPFSGDFSEPRVVEAMRNAAGRAIATFSSQGLVVEELHVDFDAAESQLDAYRGWLDRLRADHPNLRLTITALPSWLDRAAFARVVRTVDSFVLQLHSLPKSSGPGQAPVLFDTKQSLVDIHRASRLRAGFRVALPTYGYDLIYDAGGSLRSVVAEGLTPPVPEGGVVRRVRADPRELSSFVKSLQRERPTLLEAIVWYRLPVETDRRNWHARTLETVLRGGNPEPRLRAEARRTAPGLFEVDLLNDGDDEAAMPVVVEAKAGSRIVALDAVNGFRFERIDEDVVRFTPAADMIFPVAPEERRTLGWVRLDGDKEVAAHVLSP